MTARPQPPPELVARIRSICDALTPSVEHRAWTGTSWRTGGTTFAHVLQIDGGRPPAYAGAFGTDGPATVVTFQADPDDHIALARHGHPFVIPPWRPNIVGIVIEPTTDWAELATLIADSHQTCGGSPS